MPNPKTITIDNTEYVRADSVERRPPGSRRLLVVDNGWVFVGDVAVDTGRAIEIRAAANVRSWSGGFGLLTTDPKAAKAKFDKCATVVIQASRIVFMVPVPDDFGL